MRAAGLEQLASILPGGLTEAEGSRAAGGLIDGLDHDSATAAFVFNDQSAVGFLATVRASGIDVPRQLSVVGYDDSRLARATWARLTTIGQDTAAIARTAVERAIARIAGDPVGKPVLIKPTLIERATTAQPTAGPVKVQH
jgi:DNA-binding LacI/PurR family transcriptional regulator